MQNTTYRGVVPVHSQVMVGQNIRGPVDVMQSQLDGRHHALAHCGAGVAGGGGEEPGNVDIVLVVAVTVGMDLITYPASQQVGGQAEGEPGEQQEPHD